MPETSCVFDYGSLIWRPDFPWLDARPASIDGWTRRFWHGSHDHRGTKTDPGRTVTFDKAPSERCYGRAFRIGLDVFEHLDDRERSGYERHSVDNGSGYVMVQKYLPAFTSWSARVIFKSQRKSRCDFIEVRIENSLRSDDCRWLPASV